MPPLTAGEEDGGDRAGSPGHHDDSGALQRKSSCQTFQAGCFVDSAMAPVTSTVFTQKYAAMPATSGLRQIGHRERTSHPTQPAVCTAAVACMVMTMAAVLKIVR